MPAGSCVFVMVRFIKSICVTSSDTNVAILWPLFTYSNCILVLQKWSPYKDIDLPCSLFMGRISHQAERAKENEDRYKKSDVCERESQSPLAYSHVSARTVYVSLQRV